MKELLFYKKLHKWSVIAYVVMAVIFCVSAITKYKLHSFVWWVFFVIAVVHLFINYKHNKYSDNYIEFKIWKLHSVHNDVVFKVDVDYSKLRIDEKP